MHAEPFWQAVKSPLKEIIERNDLSKAANITVQLLGGGSRVPRVQSELSQVHPGISLERQLDASEAFATGGALYAANLSTMFRLRRFGMIDGSAYSVSLSLEPTEGVPKELEVRFIAFNVMVLLLCVHSELSQVHPGISHEQQLNASEAFATGGALYAANLSTMSRLRRFGMIDGSAWSVSMSSELTKGVPKELLSSTSSAMLLL
jgi:molecular chaperone DnaK (HSP70)